MRAARWSWLVGLTVITVAHAQAPEPRPIYRLDTPPAQATAQVLFARERWLRGELARLREAERALIVSRRPPHFKLRVVGGFVGGGATALLGAYLLLGAALASAEDASETHTRRVRFGAAAGVFLASSPCLFGLALYTLTDKPYRGEQAQLRAQRAATQDELDSVMRSRIALQLSLAPTGLRLVF